MLTWQQRGAAAASSVVLSNGRRVTVVIVGLRSNPKGAAVIFAGSAKGEVETRPLAEVLHLFHPSQAIEICAMQERLYGASGLPKPASPKDAAP